MLQPGTTVTLTGSQARNDPYRCFFNTVELDDGRVSNVNGSPEPVHTVAAEPQREDMFGTWLLAPPIAARAGRSR
jgi:hypothetical protein